MTKSPNNHGLRVSIPSSEDVDPFRTIKELREKIAAQEDLIRIQADLIDKYKQATEDIAAITVLMKERQKYHKFAGAIITGNTTTPLTNVSTPGSAGSSLWTRSTLQSDPPSRPDERTGKKFGLNRSTPES